MPPDALTATDIRVLGEGGRAVVDGASLTLTPGEIVGLTGPSGSGKSTLALALLGLARPPMRLAGGRVLLGGRDLLVMDEDEAARVRGREIALIVQNPRAALHPMLPVGRQIGRLWRRHGGSGDADARAVDMLRLVGINDPERRSKAFAHELSGGMAQRALIAAALSTDPAVLVADEPTSGLDVTVQAQFLDMMAQAARGRGLAMLLVTQEPGVLANYCDRVLVMEAGRIAADRPVRDHFAALPRRLSDAAPLVPPRSGAPVVRVEGLSKRFPVRGTDKQVHAVDGVGFELRPGETLGLVGESGSGKTTAGRAILRLIEPGAGRVEISGQDVTVLAPGPLRQLRRRATIVRQDPFDSFDPRWTIGRSLAEPLDIHGIGSKTDRLERVRHLARLAGCDADVLEHRPRDLPAGALQRLAIARALATDPDFVVLDEPTSVLTPSARREVVELLRRLQAELGVAFLFISHDLTTIAAVCHRVAVMYLGQIVEIGTADQVFRDPRHPYTRALISAHLGEDPADRRLDRPRGERLEGEIPSPIDLPPGCYLASRCPHALDRCRVERQPLRTLPDGRQARCWRTEELPLPKEGAA